MTHDICLQNADHRCLATAKVTQQGQLYLGDADLSSLPPDMLALFQEFDELVNDQVFSVLDELHQRIEDLGILIRIDGGPAQRVNDLQIYPSNGGISFRVPSDARLHPSPQPTASVP